ncbi:aminotransferase class III-fold pyridoxal phosphate-dependent enzyme [Rhodobacteraceae bacterium N5(2021)]|uniref:Aminotransferase class III-fold pyridoxal phosphate-dependent enzyme n=1 Tax=Gymnodinialimonas phycosphaerae TaxID=2841589 RepID=A0A975YHE1_9RHOB|nr:aminotransferase class III-fold pyridoxal phosphate-dependent enzyme [Gymnodinialimonas phycosphaerae]MBY4892708.1 aminotransferase class III-fold pyridoxal phosphate-dependent enzyme [Gymnodinialimonas phycosphaerae]
MAYDATNSLEAHWMPFSDNRGFKEDPRLVVRAEGVHLYDHRGGQLLDGSSGLFCSPAGHCHPKIAEAVAKQMTEYTYVMPFQAGHPGSFKLAEKISRMLPEQMNHVFFTNSGSESVDTAMKIVMAYWNARGETRPRFVSRERAYHGVNIGGVSLSGMVKNRDIFHATVPGVMMLRHTYDPSETFIPGGHSEHNGVELANDLERMAQTYGGNNIAAVFVEPVAGSTGALPPPKGYLQQLRKICDQYGILLVFDEVITGFGRMGTAFAAQKYDVEPDIITMAKALTNGSIPMGAVACRDDIYETVVGSSKRGLTEFFHGYTYSGHPAACAAGNAMMEIIEEEDLIQRSADLIPYFEDALMDGLKGHEMIKDIRVAGLMAGVEVHAEGGPGMRGTELQKRMFWDGLSVKFTGDNAIIAPQFIATRDHVDEIVGRFRKTLDHMLANG